MGRVRCALSRLNTTMTKFTSKLKKLLKDPSKRPLIVALIVPLLTAIGFEVSPEFADTLRNVLTVLGAIS